MEGMSAHAVRPLLIRADAGGSLGTGHVMRMIALAQAYQDRGGLVTLACARCPEDIAERVRREGIGFELIPGGTPGSATDLEQTVACAKSLSTEWVVLDGYHFDADYQRASRAAGFRVLAVDDYGHCDIWAADAVLNQNIFAPEMTYRSEVEGCRFLLGTRFALLRREFRADADTERARQTGPIHRLLVTLGGVDADNVTGRLFQALNILATPPLELKLLTGVGNPHLEDLRQLAAASPHSVEVLQHVLDMPVLYHWVDGVISAGGSTCWEWMFYRLPAAVVCLADNQRPVIAALVKHRLALDLGWHKDLELELTVQRLHGWLKEARDPATEPAPGLAVDGLGACRVASMFDGTNAWLRRAGAEDARLWFKWANDPAVRTNGFHPDPILWETHLEWFERHRHSADSRLWIGFDLDQQPLGYVRLHRCDGDEWEMGVAVAPECRRQGVALRLVQLALRQFSPECRPSIRRDMGQPDDRAESDARTMETIIVARIRPANTASLNLFRALGFQHDTTRSTADCCVLTHKLVNFL
jgi:UDP-2,4-diacetamido-2,4,6-trideoxy-beta-L-altropyranose hydrolase